MSDKRTEIYFFKAKSKNNNDKIEKNGNPTFFHTELPTNTNIMSYVSSPQFFMKIIVSREYAGFIVFSH